MATVAEGRLFIVSTPIGNLEDITSRARRILGEVDLIAAEDTRRTGRLLTHLGLGTSTTSFHDFNKEKKLERIIDTLKKGKDVAIVSDAGTPGISDPAYFLVKHVVQEGVDIIPIPGPSALLAALVVSGLPTDRFIFEGFLPRRGNKRRERLRELQRERRTLIFYESPHRICDMLDDVSDILGGDRRVSVSRELTKRFEETIRGRVADLAKVFKEKNPKGEFVVVVSGFQKH